MVFGNKTMSSATAPIDPSIAACEPSDAAEPLPLQPPVEQLQPLESVSNSRDSSGSNMSWS